MIKNLNINKNKFNNTNKEKLKLYTSCLLIATTTAVGMKLTSIGLPFHIDNIKQQIYIAKLITSNNDTKTFISTNKEDNLLYYYDKWKPSSNNNMMNRTFKIYKLEINSEEEIKTFLKKINNNTVTPITEGTEYKELISTEEIDQSEYWQAFIYNKSDNNYTIIKETSLHNVLTTIIYMITTIGLCSLPYTKYKEKTLEKKKV